MSIILGIETSTKICSVAVSNGEGLLAIKEEGGSYSHSEKLTVFIEDVLKQSGISIHEIDAVALSQGPGSYTGLRIGTSTAKGLCYGLDIPLIAVSTLQAMARNFYQNQDTSVNFYSPMIDARRMEVYTALYDNQNEMIESIAAKIVDAEIWNQYLVKGKILFFGDGAEKSREVLKENENAIYSSAGFPSAKFINQIGYQKFKQQQFEDVAYFEPYYLKDFIATTPKKLL